MKLSGTDIRYIVSEVMKNVLAVSEEYNSGPGKMVLYHGTSKLFDRFSMSKINTGQHSQDFGFGLYFTTDKESAKFYADELSHTMTLKEKFDSVVHSFNKKDYSFERYLEMGLSSLVKKYVEGYIRNGVGDEREWMEFLDIIDKPRRYGYVYTVEVSNPNFIDRPEYVRIRKERGLTDKEMNGLLIENGYNGIIYDMNTRIVSDKNFTGEKNVVIIDDSIISIIDREKLVFDYVMKLKI